MKLGIIGGAGLLGSTTAFCVGCKNLVDEIKLIDIRDNVVQSHAMDLTQAFLPLGGTKVTAATYEDLGDCDIILSAASMPAGKVKDRNARLAKNIEMIKPICEKVKKYCKDDTILITSAAPIDVLIYVFWETIGWKKNQFIGFSANDTLRLKWAVELVTGKKFDKIDAMCIGEHGDAQVRLYDQMKYNGEPLKLTEEEYRKIEDATKNWFAEWQNLEAGRTTGWTSAVMLTEYIEAIVKDSNRILPCSTPLVDQFGYNHVSMGMPCQLGRCGVKKVIDPLLTDSQKEDLDKAAEKIRGLITSVGF